MKKIKQKLMSKYHSLSNRDKKAVQLLSLTGLAALPLISVMGCGMARSFSCTMCGSSTTYTPIYASGTEETTDIEYQSCIGPASVINCGLNTQCWPTECMYVKFKNDENVAVTGTVCYYNKFGCIDDKDVMSVGSYGESVNCLVSWCSVGKYTEKVNSDGTKATKATNCFGITCNESPTDVRNYNDALPRQFKFGCCSACHGEDE